MHRYVYLDITMSILIVCLFFFLGGGLFFILSFLFFFLTDIVDFLLIEVHF